MKRQNGAAIIFSLIILGVLTAVGVASIQPSGIELKTMINAHDQTLAFEAAETALLKIESQLSKNPPPAEAHFSQCMSDDCFNPRCEGGLCFAGEYYPTQGRSQCYLANPEAGIQQNFWSDKKLSVWSSARRHQTINIEGLGRPVQYIIEFLCFKNVGAELGTGISTHVTTTDDSENENFKPLYRITVMASGNESRTPVILQSTYRLAQGGGGFKS